MPWGYLVLCVIAAAPLWGVLLSRYCRPFKRWMAGYSRWSRCWLGQHRWDMPGGHCERCGLCDEFFGPHTDCRIARSQPHGDGL